MRFILRQAGRNPRFEYRIRIIAKQHSYDCLGSDASDKLIHVVCEVCREGTPEPASSRSKWRQKNSLQIQKQGRAHSFWY